jgi:cytochrome c553
MNILFSKKMGILAVVIAFMISGVAILNGCAASQKVTAKSGAQLWAENCQRCHNTPSPSTFSAEKWETIGMHMQSRALLTDKERDKIIEFLKQ